MINKLFLRRNRILKEQLQSEDKKKQFIDSTSNTKFKRLYLIDHLPEIERIQDYLPTLMKLKRLVKKCQCSFRDEDQYSSIKDSVMPNHVNNRINLVSF